MPSLITHNYFALDFLASNNDGSGVFSYPSSFRLGSQGPDPLFFAGLIPFRGFSIKVMKSKLGSKLHRMDGNLLFKELFKQLNNIDDLTSKDIFFSFIMGQFAHYCLDSICHPYIYYFSGFNKQGNLKGPYHYSHSHFESRIDSAFATNRKELQYVYHPENILKIPEDELIVINDNFNVVLERIFNVKLKKNYYLNAVKNMIFAYRFTNKGKKGFGRIFHKTVLHQLVIPRNEDDKSLNPNHIEWQVPYSGVVCKESFYELYYRGLDKFKKHYENIDIEKPTYEDIKGAFNGLNYSGVPLNQVIKYQDLDGKLLDFKLKRKN